MKRKRGGIVSQLLMILLVVVIIFPLYFMTANSFKTHEEYVNNMAGLPQTFTVQNFVEAFRGKPFGQWFMNSFDSYSCSGFLLRESLHCWQDMPLQR